MVLKKLVTFLYNFIILGGQSRTKAVPSSFELTPSKCNVALEKVTEGGASSSAPEDFEGESCCICLSRLNEGEDTRVLPCLHRFHRACVNRWFSACTNTCPLCRFSMGEEVKFHFREMLTDEMVIWFSSFHGAGF